ncbi:putative metalloprotease CJM1_0395 family protein [Kordiimonas pumila]|uniref:Metalloprotease CJM1_0395 family protein n=1 Tax=Kordiimonas pumila TaxID=2161677 RepID=A0ABV7D907_9PROT|nr:putative metalloprotease CJM1_0395 family protein [Kordiimonas pumila]
MTTTSILPSSGPPPPGLKRPSVPENLRPKVGASAVTLEKQPVIAQKTDAKAAASVSGLRGPSPVNLGGSGAVVLQVQESASTNVSRDTELSEEDKVALSRLKARDREVRAHEAAHAASGRGYTGSPSFEYVRGADGTQYAVGGHVNIDVSEVPGSPQETIAKMEVVRQAALAPAQPSGQDRAVAAAAAVKLREAQAELAQQNKAENQNGATSDVAAGGQTDQLNLNLLA